jgi:hypothetical protein
VSELYKGITTLRSSAGLLPWVTLVSFLGNLVILGLLSFVSVYWFVAGFGLDMFGIRDLSAFNMLTMNN